MRSSDGLVRRDPGWAWALAALAAGVVALKLPTLDTPAYWDEASWMHQAYGLYQQSLLNALPGLHPPATFFGHPPGLHVMVAAIWKLFGHSIEAAHLLIAAFAAMAVVFTALLGRQLFDTKTGLLAGLFLAMVPVFFAQAGMFLGDLPVTALGIAAIYFGLTKRYGWYLACAVPMVLIKETALALVAAWVLYVLLVEGWRSRDAWRRAAAFAVPVLAAVMFFAAQMAATGEPFFIYEDDVELFGFRPIHVWRQFRLITAWLFVDQLRFLFTLPALFTIARRPGAWRHPAFLLCGLVVALSGYSFSVLYQLPRYLLPVLPFLVIVGTASLLSLARRPAAQAILAAALTAVFAWSLAHQPLIGNSEVSMRYLDVVRVDLAMCRLIEARFSDATILAAFPQTHELRYPDLGYVRRRLDVGRPRSLPTSEGDLLFVSAPWGAGRRVLRSYARAEGWRLIERIGNEHDLVAELYAAPAE